MKIRILLSLTIMISPNIGNAAMISQKTLPGGLSCKWFAQAVPFRPGVDTAVGVYNPDSGYKPAIPTVVKIEGWTRADRTLHVIGGACSIHGLNGLTLVSSAPIGADITGKVISPGWRCFAAGEDVTKTSPMIVMVLACS